MQRVVNMIQKHPDHNYYNIYFRHRLLAGRLIFCFNEDKLCV